MRSPSTVCWRIRFHSSRIERSGLVDDVLWDRDLAYVVEAGGVLGAALLPGVKTERVGYLHGQGYDSLAVGAGVFVVFLDQVGEQDRRAEVGVSEFEALLQAAAALVGEEC